MSPANDVAVDLENHVAVVTIRRPPANYFDVALLRDLADALLTLGEDGCRAAVLAAAGRHFCAGMNFGGAAPTGMAEIAGSIYREAARLFRVPMPVVAAVQGAAVGGGLGLACAADFRVVCASTRLHANFAALGFHQGFGLSVTLPRLVGQQRATELLYTGRQVLGGEAVEMGLADRFASDEDPLREALAFAREIERSSPLAVRAMKETLRTGLADEVEAAIEREVREQSRLWATEDCAIGLAAARDRRTPRFLGR